LCKVSKNKRTKDTFDSVIKKATKHELGQRYRSVELMKKDIEALSKLKSEKKKTSKLVFVEGLRPGIGVTHICLCLAKWISSYGTVSLLDFSRNHHLKSEALKGRLTNQGILKLDEFNLIPVINKIRFEEGLDVKIIDCSGMTKEEVENLRESLVADLALEDLSIINCLVFSGKHALYEELKAIKNYDKDYIVLANLISAKEFYDYQRVFFDRELYRIPCIYDWRESPIVLDELLGDFRSLSLEIQVNKKAIGSLIYEKFVAFRKKISLFVKSKIQKKEAYS